VHLAYREQSCVLDARGGRVHRYDVDGTPVLTPLGLPPAAYPSALLAPWPNRVAHGSWTWDQEHLQLPVNDQPLGSSLHGLVSDEVFTVAARSESLAHLVTDLAPSAGYPFSLRVEATYALTDEGLVCSLTTTNTGDRPAPVALGVHPYLDTRGTVDNVVLTVPAARTVAVDEQWQETGRPAVDGTSWDLRGGRRVADAVVDTAWTDLEAREGRTNCRVVLPGGDTVTVWGGATCRYVVVYSADTLPGPFRRRTLAVEPCTAPANALRSGIDLDVLAPGASLTLDWGLALTSAETDGATR
jgi:aldose 1-epimerase